MSRARHIHGNGALFRENGVALVYVVMAVVEWLALPPADAARALRLAGGYHAHMIPRVNDDVKIRDTLPTYLEGCGDQDVHGPARTLLGAVNRAARRLPRGGLYATGYVDFFGTLAQFFEAR